MKRFFQTILFAIAIMVACSCEELQKDGAWDPVELDKSNIEFTAEGGQETVTALNYTSWWINGGYESAVIDKVAGASAKERNHLSPLHRRDFKDCKLILKLLLEPRCKSLFGSLLIAHEVWRLKPA